MSRLFESVKYSFSPEEVRDLGEALAREARTVFDLQERKANLTAELKTQIKAANGRVSDLATKINSGFEMREVEVLVLLETPGPGMKRVVRADTSEHIRDEPMTLGEMQRSFGFQEPDKE
jgi:hypothetical protein